MGTGHEVFPAIRQAVALPVGFIFNVRCTAMDDQPPGKGFCTFFDQGGRMRFLLLICSNFASSSWIT